MSEKDKNQEQEVAPAEEQVAKADPSAEMQEEEDCSSQARTAKIEMVAIIALLGLIAFILIVFGSTIRSGVANLAARISSVDSNVDQLISSYGERQSPATAEEEDYILLHRHLLGKQGQLTPLQSKTVGQLSDDEVNLMCVLRDDIKAIKNKKTLRAKALDHFFVSDIDAMTTISMVDEWLDLQRVRRANQVQRMREISEVVDASQIAKDVLTISQTLEKFGAEVERSNLSAAKTQAEFQRELGVLQQSVDKRIVVVENRLASVEDTQGGMSRTIAMIEGDILEIKAINRSQDEALVAMDNTIKAMAPAIENARKRLDAVEERLPEGKPRQIMLHDGQGGVRDFIYTHKSVQGDTVTIWGGNIDGYVTYRLKDEVFQHSLEKPEPETETQTETIWR